MRIHVLIKELSTVRQVKESSMSAMVTSFYYDSGVGEEVGRGVGTGVGMGVGGNVGSGVGERVGMGVGGDVVGLAEGMKEGPELRLGALLGDVLPEGAAVF